MRHIDFMRMARTMFILSMIVTLVGLISLSTGLVSNRPGLNLGVDFTGGLLLDLRFEKAVTTGEVREAIRSLTGHDPTVQAVELKGAATGSEFSVRLPNLPPEQQDKLMAELEPKLGKFQTVSIAKVSPVIRAELLTQAILALAMASVLQIIYIWLRYELKFGITAVVAVLHDALITLGLMSLFRLEVGPAFVAAVLTVIGYSVNDTIIIFDRIRENLKGSKRGADLPKMVNLSINQTLPRTINTVLTTLFSVVAIMLFGGETTRDFAAALLIGILSGTYSSIFVASALWVWWRQWENTRKSPRRA